MLSLSNLSMMRVSILGMLRISFTIALLILLCIVPDVHAGVLSDAPPSPLELQIPGPSPTAGYISVGLKMINHADHAFVIQRNIEIDYQTGFKWAALTAVQAIGKCDEYDYSYSSHALIRIEAGADLDVAPWHGWTCGDGRQCAESCQKNGQAGAGNYRFVVVTAEGERIPSRSFTLPAQ